MCNPVLPRAQGQTFNSILDVLLYLKIVFFTAWEIRQCCTIAWHRNVTWEKDCRPIWDRKQRPAIGSQQSSRAQLRHAESNECHGKGASLPGLQPSHLHCSLAQCHPGAPQTHNVTVEFGIPEQRTRKYHLANAQQLLTVVSHHFCILTMNWSDA